MKTFEDFCKWEKTTPDTMPVYKRLMDVAGDVIAGILLSRIVFLLQQREANDPHVVIVRDGKVWIPKKRKTWWHDCRLTPRQVDTALTKLIDRGLVEKAVYQVNGAPTVHVTVSLENLMRRIESPSEPAEDAR